MREYSSLEILLSTFGFHTIHLKLHCQCLGQVITEHHILERLIREKVKLMDKWTPPPPRKNVIDSEV